MVIPDAQLSMNWNRTARINRQLQRVIAEEVTRRSNRMSLITVMRVSYDPHRAHAEVVVSVYPPHKTREALAFLMRHAREIGDIAARASRLSRLHCSFRAVSATEDLASPHGL